MQSLRKILHLPNRKNSKLTYYTVNFVRYITPGIIYRMLREPALAKYEKLDDSIKKAVTYRVNYYNKLSVPEIFDKEKLLDDLIKSDTTIPLGELKLKTPIGGKIPNSTYVLDSYSYMRYFKKNLIASFLFGDITEVPKIPSFVKSRPIEGENANSVLLPLDKVRHFTTVNDRLKFGEKKDMLIGRAYVDQPHRIKFWEMYFNHPKCNLGNINPNLKDHEEWRVKPISIDEHLKYKFILCIEGNDVASNLKWVMSSNSLAVMPKPTYETWFMEGKLIADYHYVEIKKDYSDLEEKLNYFIAHPREAELISLHANEYVKKILDNKLEKLIALMVINKYFISTGQIVK